MDFTTNWEALLPVDRLCSHGLRGRLCSSACCSYVYRGWILCETLETPWFFVELLVNLPIAN